MTLDTNFDPDLFPQDISTVCDRIETEISRIMSYWKDTYKHTSEEWFHDPDSAALLSGSMLDWQVSLAGCLRRWLGCSTDGELILAWANLGTLVEGMLKLFLCVYLSDYRSDAAATGVAGLVKDGEVSNPDGLKFEQLKQYCAKCGMWKHTLKGDDWDKWIDHVQQRRNAIHSFKPRQIGTFEEWMADVRRFYDFVDEIDGRLPYHD
jgi:hypothetical protein